MNVLLMSTVIWLLTAIPGPAVVELADENLGPLLNQITEGKRLEDLKVEKDDVYTGAEAIRQKSSEIHTAPLKGWNYRIVENPKEFNEFRYIRFAWKKSGGGAVLIAFAADNGSWRGLRYVSGTYNLGGSGFRISNDPPTEWTVVTRDLFKDFGSFTMTSILFSSNKEGVALFDHVLLGRTVQDLDKTTQIALGKFEPAQAVEGKYRDQLWDDLVSTDQGKSLFAFRIFQSVAVNQVDFIRNRLGKPAKIDPIVQTIKDHIKKLSSEEFEVRELASEDLKKLGLIVVPLLLDELDCDNPQPELAYRAKEILKHLNVSNQISPKNTTQLKASRITRILERAKTADATKLLDAMAAGQYGNEYVQEAKAASKRLSMGDRPTPKGQ